MKERPLIFSAPMVKAILDGRKTQTRRTWGLDVINESPNDWRFCEFIEGKAKFRRPDGSSRLIACPYGVPGDRLRVKEKHYLYGKWVNNGFNEEGRQKWTFKALTDECRYQDAPPAVVQSTRYRREAWYCRPAIYMQRRTSRITLEITNIRVERVFDISKEGAIAEGAMFHKSINDIGHSGWRHDYGDVFVSPRGSFIWLWNSINAKKHGRLWGNNPWCWPITFKRIDT